MSSFDIHSGDADVNAWPAFADLLAATAMLFLVLFTVVALPALERAEAGEARQSRLLHLDSALRVVQRSDPSVRVEIVGDYVRVSIADSATFDQARYELARMRPAGRRILESLSNHLIAAFDSGLANQIHVAGHASYEGDAQENWRLSSQRAISVSVFLIHRGLNPCAVSALGRGTMYPARPGLRGNEINRPYVEDRRIEIEVHPRIPGDQQQELLRTERCKRQRVDGRI